jgi:glucuronoarabinoxylan endo-1,4-beta-xylanase
MRGQSKESCSRWIEGRKGTMVIFSIAKRTGLSLLACLLVFLACNAFVCAGTAGTASSVTIDGATRYQTMDGFGFSEAFGRAASMHNASAAAQEQMLDLLFSPRDGAGFTILRNIINSDATSIEPNSPGSPTAAPQYVWDGSDSSQVWLSQQAQRYGVRQIYADAWSAPGYMKTNNDQANGGTLCGAPGATACNTGDWRQAYANYLAKYIQDYRSVGINIANVGFVNEPNLTTTYSSMVMNPTQTEDFVKVLGPTLRAAHLSTEVTCCDAEGWDLAPAYTSAIMNDPVARLNTQVISSHGYTAPPTSPLAAGNKHVWQTEWADFNPYNPAWDDGSAASGFTWAQHIYTALTGANVSAFLYWWGVNTSDTNSGLIHLTTDNTLEVSSRFWAFTNYSRFIRPGAVRIGTTTANSNLDTAAFRNLDGSTTIVVLNTASSDAATSFTLQHCGGAVAIPYLTNGTNNTAQQKPLAIRMGTFSTVVPARSLVTYQIAAI